MHKQNFAFFNENRKRNGELLEMELRMYRSTFSFNIIYIISLSLYITFTLVVTVNNVALVLSLIHI